MLRRKRAGSFWVAYPTGRILRQGFGAGAFAAIAVTIVSCGVAASPLVNSSSPDDAISARISLLHRALIYAKEGSRKLVDGRWNLSQSEAKLGITLSADEAEQLLACTGQIVCKTPDVHNEEEDRIGRKVTASAVSVLRPDLLVTAKHVFFAGKKAIVPFGSCSFRSYSRRKAAIPVVVDKDQRKGYVFNNEDFIVLRLKRELEGCSSFAVNRSDAPLAEGDQVLSVTGHQFHTLNKISGREPVVAKGEIRDAFSGKVLGGAPFYFADLDFDLGGSGGAVFALKDGRPVSDGEGRLILKGISVAYGLRAKSGKPYSEERNFTIIVGLEGDFWDLVKGKAAQPPAVEPASCPQGDAAKIEVISDSVASAQPETPALDACSRSAKTGKAGTGNAECRALTKAVKRAAAQHGKAKHEFRLRNDTSCKICFTYDRCNDYGCWDEAVKASAKSTLFAGVREQAPMIKTPQFCR
jgi:Trypsin-like peptidase domain